MKDAGGIQAIIRIPNRCGSYPRKAWRRHMILGMPEADVSGDDRLLSEYPRLFEPLRVLSLL